MNNEHMGVRRSQHPPKIKKVNSKFTFHLIILNKSVGEPFSTHYQSAYLYIKYFYQLK